MIKVTGWISLLALTSGALAQAPNPSPPDVETLRNTLEREVALAKEQGYVPHSTEHWMARAEAKWQAGAWLRQPGQNQEKASAVAQEVRRLLLWAKGALLDLKLPTWAHDVHYYNENSGYGSDPKTRDPDRGVIFLGNWHLPGDFPGQWFRGHCRPHREGPALIESFRQQGWRVGTYLSGGMIPITYALLPPNEEDWTNDFMRRYAGGYWHYGERWWGATGDKPGFRAWMLPHLDFAHQVGFDFVHLDEAWGGYPEAREMNDRHPGYLVVTNNFAMTYVDQETFRFGWTAMGEAAGSPRDWDHFNVNLRDRGLKAYNLTTWSYLYYQLDEPEFYHNLAYATTIANKTTDVSLGSPTREYVSFAHRFRDYLFGAYVDLDVPQDCVRVSAGVPSVRAGLTRRFLLSGTEEWIVHLFNIDPQVESTGEITVEVTPGEARLPANPVITFASPQRAPQELELVRKDQTLTCQVPGVKIWGLAVIGQRLFPRVALRLASRGGGPPPHPLDAEIVPGEEFEVGVKVEPLSPVREDFGLELFLPPGWRAREAEATTEGERRFIVGVPARTPYDRGYAVTPLVRQGGEAMPSFPLQLEARDPLTFRLFPPCIDSPARAPAGLQLAVKNNSAASPARLKLTAPAGWQVEPEGFQLDLGPGETRRLPLSLAAPDVGVSFWYHRDAELAVEWQLGPARGRSPVRVRVFPAPFAVYHDGPEKLILHGYPNLSFRGKDFEAAKSALQAGEYVVLWLANQDPGKGAPLVDWFLANGGGVVWMGQPFPGENCPVELEADGARPKSMSLRSGPEPALRLAAPVLRFRSYYESAQGFEACTVKAKEWARAAAVWGPPVEGSAVATQGSPAVVISTDPQRRIVYVASDLETTTEDSYRFEDRLHRQSHWYLTYYLYHLLAWAAGAEN